MKKYNAQEYINTINKKLQAGNTILRCPFCGGNKFTSPDKFATILTGNDLSGIEIGTSVPSGMLICENCGHIEFFALGALGLLPKEEDANGK